MTVTTVFVDGEEEGIASLDEALVLQDGGETYVRYWRDAELGFTQPA